MESTSAEWRDCPTCPRGEHHHEGADRPCYGGIRASSDFKKCFNCNKHGEITPVESPAIAPVSGNGTQKALVRQCVRCYKPISTAPSGEKPYTIHYHCVREDETALLSDLGFAVEPAPEATPEQSQLVNAVAEALFTKLRNFGVGNQPNDVLPQILTTQKALLMSALNKLDNLDARLDRMQMNMNRVMDASGQLNTVLNERTEFEQRYGISPQEYTDLSEGRTTPEEIDAEARMTRAASALQSGNPNAHIAKRGKHKGKSCQRTGCPNHSGNHNFESDRSA